MEFSDWQLDTLRKCLNNYRTAKARSGRLLSWAGVVARIVNKPSVSVPVFESFISDESGEALRRFGAGTSTLQTSKLEHLAQFLTDEGFLRPEELRDDPDELEGLLAIHRHLANDTEVARRLLAKVHTSYKATRAPEIVINLALSLDRSGTFFRVEEEVGMVAVVDAPYAKYYKKDGNKALEGRYRGYAFVSTALNLLHIFLRGASPEDRITYVQAEDVAWDLGPSAIFLMRCGTLSPAVVMGDRDADGPFMAENIYRFLPIGVSPRQRDLQEEVS